MPADDPRVRPVTRKDLEKLAAAGRLYAVLDACDEPEILEKVRTLPRERAGCLIPGKLEEDELAVSPYLAQVDPALLDWLMSAVWSRPWGILVAADTGFRPLRRHLRRFLNVEGPEDQPLYFRFYDPRILPDFLDTCDPDQRAELFGPVLAFGVGAAGGSEPALLLAP